MGLKFRLKNTQMKQKKRFLCGNNGNTQLPKNKTAKKPCPISLIINTKYPFKNLRIHFVLYTIFACLKSI